MEHITFDLETLGNTSAAPIVQIGAVKFTELGDILDVFSRDIKLESLTRYNFELDYSTIQWWFEQENDALKRVFCSPDKIDIRQALYEFINWLGKPSEYVYWSHATFDPPILNNNFIKVGLVNPIPFRAHRDIRTLTHFTGFIEGNFKGVKHNAADDCLNQAAYISNGLILLNKLKNR